MVRGGDEGQHAGSGDGEIGLVVPGQSPSWAAGGGIGRYRDCAVLGVFHQRRAGDGRGVGLIGHRHGYVQRGSEAGAVGPHRCQHRNLVVIAATRVRRALVVWGADEG